MKSIKSQKGQALIIIALAAVVLFGFAALTIDGSRSFSDRRHAQNAADTSALTAALAKIRNQNYTDAALARAASNSYDNNGVTNFVTVNNPPAYGPYSCANSPATCNEYIQVVIKSHVPTTFARVLGWTQFTNTVDAVARAKGTITNNIFMPGAGFYATKSGTYDDCFKVLGSANLTMHDTGIFVNCSGADALSFGGSANIYMDADAQAVGCSDDQSFPIGGAGQITCGATAQTVNESTFAGLPTTLPTPSANCTTARVSSNPMLPGYYNSAVSIGAGTTFTPGTYCFNNSLNLGNMSVNFSGTGTVQWVLSSSVSLAGTADFDDLEIYANNASFTVKSTGTLTADRFRFFGNGNSSFVVQGGTVTSGNAYIYSETGEIDINAQAHVNVTCPPQGDTFGGLLLYMPWNNPNDFELNGGTGNTWNGTVLMPSAEITYNGGSDFELHGQVIGNTFKINGGSEGDIYYDTNYIPQFPNSPTIEFTD
jgi:Flp pilus assembly protein TadG